MWSARALKTSVPVDESKTPGALTAAHLALTGTARRDPRRLVHGLLGGLRLMPTGDSEPAPRSLTRFPDGSGW